MKCIAPCACGLRYTAAARRRKSAVVKPEQRVRMGDVLAELSRGGG